MFECDIVREVMMHLRPRHLFHLMLTNKQIYDIIRNNKYYFQRVAAQVLFGIWEYWDFRFTDEGVKYIHMRNLPEGYHKAMETYMDRFMEDRDTPSLDSRVEKVQRALLQYGKVKYAPHVNGSNYPNFRNLHEIKKAIADCVTAQWARPYHLPSIGRAPCPGVSKSIKRSLNFLDDDVTMTLPQKTAIVKSIISKIGDFRKDWGFSTVSYKLSQTAAKHFDRIPSKIALWLAFMKRDPEILSIDIETRSVIIKNVRTIAVKSMRSVRNHLDISNFRKEMGYVETQDAEMLRRSTWEAKGTDYMYFLDAFNTLATLRYV